MQLKKVNDILVVNGDDHTWLIAESPVRANMNKFTGSGLWLLTEKHRNQETNNI